DRVQEYLRKAIHEAKVETSWINPAGRYDEAVLSFAKAVLDPAQPTRFLTDFIRFQARVAAFGALNSLAQVLVKVTAPGVPDFYQGTELWDLSLVDPDNRRPVEWPLRARLLNDLAKEIESSTDLVGLARSLLATRENGRIKLYLTRQTLAFRHARPLLFERGEYRPLEAQGPLSEHVCAFARVGGGGGAAGGGARPLAQRQVGGAARGSRGPAPPRAADPGRSRSPLPQRADRRASGGGPDGRRPRPRARACAGQLSGRAARECAVMCQA